MAGAVGVQPVVEQGGVVAGQHLVEAVDQGDSSLGGDPADGLVEGGDAVVGVALGAVRLQGGGCILASSQGSSPTSRTRSVWRRAVATSPVRVAANRSGSWAARPVRRSKLVLLTPTATTTMVWSPSRRGPSSGSSRASSPSAVSPETPRLNTAWAGKVVAARCTRVQAVPSRSTTVHPC